MAEIIAKRYGNALFDLAIENNEIETIEKELKTLEKVLESENNLITVLNSSQISQKEKSELINNIFNNDISETLLGLINIVIKKGRQKNLTEIIKYSIEKINEYRGNLKVCVTSVKPLTEDKKNKIINKLSKITKKNIILEEIVDKSLIGGLIIKIGDRVIDNSVKGKLNSMRKQLLANS